MVASQGPRGLSCFRNHFTPGLSLTFDLLMVRDSCIFRQKNYLLGRKNENRQTFKKSAHLEELDSMLLFIFGSFNQQLCFSLVEILSLSLSSSMIA